MINSIVEGVKDLISEYNYYPRLKIFNHMKTKNTVIVLFTDINTGVWLYNKNKPSMVGESSNTIGEDNFEDFDGRIVLTNK